MFNEPWNMFHGHGSITTHTTFYIVIWSIGHVLCYRTWFTFPGEVTKLGGALDFTNGRDEYKHDLMNTTTPKVALLSNGGEVQTSRNHIGEVAILLKCC